MNTEIFFVVFLIEYLKISNLGATIHHNSISMNIHHGSKNGADENSVKLA